MLKKQRIFSLRKFGKLRAASLLEAVLSLTILLICFGIAITIFASVTKHRVSVNKVLMLQEIEIFKAEMVAKNKIIGSKQHEDYILTTDVLEKDLGVAKKVRVIIEINNYTYSNVSNVYLP